MKERRPEAGDANGQEQDPRQEAIGGGRAGSHRRSQPKRCGEEKHRQVPQDESDQFSHDGLLTRVGGGLQGDVRDAKRRVMAARFDLSRRISVAFASQYVMATFGPTRFPQGVSTP
jgi:hypothetical protein